MPVVCLIFAVCKRIAGLEHVGRIEAGKRADLLIFDEELTLQQTIIAGKTEFKIK